jgi:hypothetical protein
VSGVIVDKTNLPIPFANVAFKGSSEGTVANEDGRFTLNQDLYYNNSCVRWFFRSKSLWKKQLIII